MSSPPLPQGFTLLPVRVPEDILSTVELCRVAFESDRLHQVIFPPQVDWPTRRAWAMRHTEKRLMKDPSDVARARYIKIVKNAGAKDEEMVAVAGWWAPRVGKGGAQSEEEKAKEREEAKESFPEGVPKDLVKNIFKKIDGLKGVMLGKGWEERYWYLSTLATHPDFARLGLGSALVQWGVRQAEAQMTESPEGPLEGMYLESTPAGLPVYLRNGFREVGSITHDLGEEEFYKHIIVMRKLR